MGTRAASSARARAGQARTPRSDARWRRRREQPAGLSVVEWCATALPHTKFLTVPVEMLSCFVQERGAPRYLFADNSAEFTGRLVNLWA